MGHPFTASIPHRLGRAEATRRLQAGLSVARERFGRHIAVTEETWVGDHLDFRVVVLGHAAWGTIDVDDDAVRLSVELPALLRMLAEKTRALIQEKGRLMLEKK